MTKSFSSLQQAEATREVDENAARRQWEIQDVLRTMESLEIEEFDDSLLEEAEKSAKQAKQNEDAQFAKFKRYTGQR